MQEMDSDYDVDAKDTSIDDSQKNTDSFEYYPIELDINYNYNFNLFSLFSVKPEINIRVNKQNILKCEVRKTQLICESEYIPYQMSVNFEHKKDKTDFLNLCKRLFAHEEDFEYGGSFKLDEGESYAQMWLKANGKKLECTRDSQSDKFKCDFSNSD